MRAAAWTLPLLLAACAPAPAPAPAVPPPADAAAQPQAADPARGGRRAGAWARAETEREKLPIAWEYREDYAPSAPRLLPRLIVVSQAREIPYLGQAEAAVQAAFDVREQRLVEGLRGQAELVAVLDWRQQHDWFFYAQAGVSEAMVGAALGDIRDLDIRISIEDDAAQQFYRTLRERIGATP